MHPFTLVLLLLPQSPAPAKSAAPGVSVETVSVEDVRVERDVLYRTVEDGARREELRLDAYLPAGDGPHPALLLVHGGAWMHGDKHDMGALAEGFAREGYACFAPRYRFAPAYRYPAQLADVRYALQWVRSEAERFAIDPARFAALGFSAGGHLVALLGVLDDARDAQASDPVLRQSSRPTCVVDYFGPALLSRTKEHGFDTQPPPELFGDAPDSAYAAASPLNFVTKDDVPFLLVHGDADELVPLEHSRKMDEALRAVGVPSELVIVAGGGHGDFFRTQPGGEYWKRTESWLAEHLRSSAATSSAR